MTGESESEWPGDQVVGTLFLLAVFAMGGVAATGMRAATIGLQDADEFVLAVCGGYLIYFAFWVRGGVPP